MVGCRAVVACAENVLKNTLAHLGIELACAWVRETGPS